LRCVRCNKNKLADLHSSAQRAHSKFIPKRTYFEFYFSTIQEMMNQIQASNTLQRRLIGQHRKKGWPILKFP
jgi:hypothetical protein